MGKFHVRKLRDTRTYENERVGARIDAARFEVALDRLELALQRYELLERVRDSGRGNQGTAPKN